MKERNILQITQLVRARFGILTLAEQIPHTRASLPIMVAFEHYLIVPAILRDLTSLRTARYTGERTKQSRASSYKRI